MTAFVRAEYPTARVNRSRSAPVQIMAAVVLDDGPHDFLIGAESCERYAWDDAARTVAKDGW